VSASAIFVYGTLRRGQVRARRWPRPPVRIEWATVVGRLYDLGPYPALVPGSDLVLGELWWIASADLEETLGVLDEIECYGNEDVDLYVRRWIDSVTFEGAPVRAQVYLFAHPEQLLNYPLVPPNPTGHRLWHPT
jgi:gamma-glutamylcyclotransferase (GGCT)/AIG2-like uncharacterized protein YtfP